MAEEQKGEIEGDFVEIRLVRRLPYKSGLPRESEVKLARYFDKKPYFGRSWDLYFFEDRDDGKNIFLHPLDQVQKFLAHVHKQTGIELRCPKPYHFPIEARAFELEHMGVSKSEHEFDKMLEEYAIHDYAEEKAENKAGGKNLNKAKKTEEKMKRQFIAGLRTCVLARRLLGFRDSINDGDQDVPTLFVCVDVESYERGHKSILEIGIARLETQDIPRDAHGNPPDANAIFEHAEFKHFRIIDFKHLRNGTFVADASDNFEFGESEWIHLRDAPKRIAENFRFRDGVTKGRIAFLGHDAKTDADYLRQLGYNIGNIAGLEYFDSATMFKAIRAELNPRSLGSCCNEFDIVPWHLHNAGNDAAYTLQVFLNIAATFDVSSIGLGHEIGYVPTPRWPPLPVTPVPDATNQHLFAGTKSQGQPPPPSSVPGSSATGGRNAGRRGGGSKPQEQAPPPPPTSEQHWPAMRAGKSAPQQKAQTAAPQKAPTPKVTPQQPAKATTSQAPVPALPPAQPKSRPPEASPAPAIPSQASRPQVRTPPPPDFPSQAQTQTNLPQVTSKLIPASIPPPQSAQASPPQPTSPPTSPRRLSLVPGNLRHLARINQTIREAAAATSPTDLGNGVPLSPTSLRRQSSGQESSPGGLAAGIASIASKVNGNGTVVPAVPAATNGRKPAPPPAVPLGRPAPALPLKKPSPALPVPKPATPSKQVTALQPPPTPQTPGGVSLAQAPPTPSAPFVPAAQTSAPPAQPQTSTPSTRGRGNATRGGGRGGWDGRGRDGNPSFDAQQTRQERSSSRGGGRGRGRGGNSGSSSRGGVKLNGGSGSRPAVPEVLAPGTSLGRKEEGKEGESPTPAQSQGSSKSFKKGKKMAWGELPEAPAPAGSISAPPPRDVPNQWSAGPPSIPRDNSTRGRGSRGRGSRGRGSNSTKSHARAPSYTSIPSYGTQTQAAMPPPQIAEKAGWDTTDPNATLDRDESADAWVVSGRKQEEGSWDWALSGSGRERGEGWVDGDLVRGRGLQSGGSGWD